MLERLEEDREVLRTLKARLANFERDYRDGVIDGRQLVAATARVRPELERANARIVKATQQSAVSPVFSAEDPARALLDAPIDVQRDVFRAS